jgi:hypothetical protein
MLLTIAESPLNRTIFTFLRAMFVDLITVPAVVITEISAERLIRFYNAKIAILDGQVTWDGIKYFIRVSTARTFHNLLPGMSSAR